MAFSDKHLKDFQKCPVFGGKVIAMEDVSS
jgi:hypothetical protein